MAKKDEKTALPRLRFPEFTAGTEWEEVALGAIAEIKLGKMLDNKKHTTGRLLPYLNNVSLRWNKVDTSNLPQMYFDESELELYGLRAGDVVICEGGEPGRSAVWDGRMPGLKFQKAIHRVRFLVPFDPRLLVYYLETISGTNRFEKFFTGGGIKHLTRESLELLRIPLASPAEQQKIADCLSSLDELIAAQGRKVEALKAHKRGLLQELFPREGETSPRLRFPEFREGLEWKNRAIADACLMQAGKFTTASEIREEPAEHLYPCYGGNGLRGYKETYTHSGKFPLIGRQGALCGNVRLATGKFYATEHAVVASAKKGIIAEWLYYALDRLRLNQFATGQAQPGLSVEVLEKVPVMIPSTEDEQHRIASCLSSLDTLIAAEAEKLEALKTHKKGLMQQLFPDVEEDS